MANEKMIRDALGSPVPQVYNEGLKDYTVKTVDGSMVSRGDINFNKTKLLRDVLGSVIPQLWDPVNNKWVVDTGQGRGDSGGGEGGQVAWEQIIGKPTEFTPADHTHEIADINGLSEELEKVFTQVSSGKSLLETTIQSKGGTVVKAGEIATYEELIAGIFSIPQGNEPGEEVTFGNFVTENVTTAQHTPHAGSNVEVVTFPSIGTDSVTITLK